jgi:hypothetical protein
MESQKILVETRDETIDMEPIQSVLRSSLRGLVLLQIVLKKDKFEWIHILRQLKVMKGNHRKMEMINEKPFSNTLISLIGDLLVMIYVMSISHYLSSCIIC